MSAGLTFIRACIDNGARSAFQSAPLTFFTEQEERVLRFVQQHVAQYGGLPSMAVLNENGLNLPQATSTVEYHLQRLSDRAVYSSYASRQPALHAALTQNDMASVRAIINELHQSVQSASAHRDTFTLEEASAQAWEEYLAARSRPGLQGMTYGWSLVDDLTGGLRNGDVGTIVARPGFGKSFTITRAAVAAWQGGASVAFVSMEMTAVETARRIMAMELGVNPDYLLRGRLSDWSHEDAARYQERFENRPPFTMLVGDLSKSVSDVDAMIQEHAPDYVCIDASYLLNPSDRSYKGRRWEALAMVAQDIKGLALRRNCPILQTVQFNRSQTPDEEMDLSQIGGTDVIGQVSALVLGMKRGPAPYERTRRRYTLLKNRHGPDHLTFVTNFLFDPFNMDVVEDEEPFAGPDGEWAGNMGEQPANNDWSAA